MRLSAVVNKKTVLEQKPTGESSVDADDADNRIPDQLRLIELLQILRRCRLMFDKEIPPLIILVTCVDELIDFDNPRTALKNHLPLFVSYVDAHWSSKHCSFWGLSSLGMELSDIEPNRKFVEEGPERQGYVIDSHGDRDQDLTRPFAALLG